MAKLPKKDINLYPLVVAPKKNTMKKGALFGILGTVAVLLLGGCAAGQQTVPMHGSTSTPKRIWFQKWKLRQTIPH